MRKVVTASLNGNAFQLEEGAYEAVQRYLQRSAARSAGNPDQQEILGDLEQAIADKCSAYLGPHKNVITEPEALRILDEMGPVEPDAPNGQPAGSGATACGTPRERRLFRLPTEGMMGGVCAGLAAYFAIDVVWVRLGYVLLTLCTGIWFLLWLVQLIITPKAMTEDEIAAAHGMRGTARA